MIETKMNISTSGHWPNQITLRRGWAKAVARPWNDDVSAAQLRLIRGSRDFVKACSRHLAQTHGTVVSPPLPEPSLAMWKDSGFRPWLYLDLFTRDLNLRIGKPAYPTADGTAADWIASIDIDRMAFKETWRLGEAGMKESRQATTRSTFMVTRTADTVRAFAIVGLSGSVSYLQRVAVDPASQGQGLGRSMVRSAMLWASRHGAGSMVLNTQPENAPAIGLYKSEGFARLPSGLHVLEYKAGD